MSTLQDLSDKMLNDPDGAAELLGLSPFVMSYASVLDIPELPPRSFPAGPRRVTATTARSDGREFEATEYYLGTLAEQRLAARKAKTEALWAALRSGGLIREFLSNARGRIA
jgi:hypothetical protein